MDINMQRKHMEIDDNVIKRNETEIKSLRLRLSERAGNNIKTGNPSIADLSDENRPMKLAEQFGELYDNEWTNALEELQGRFQTEKETIEYLTKIVRNTNIMVGQKAKSQLSQIIYKTHALILRSGGKEFPDNHGEKLRKLYGAHAILCQKQAAHLSFPHLDQTILDMYKERGHGILKTVDVLIRKCITIMWFMYVSNPPLCLKWTAPGEKVDYDSFKEYTKRGSRVDFCVWPAVKLHETGPLLRKGVVQPK